MIKNLMRLSLFFVFLLASESVISCSMYKITVNGKTMVGSNYDANYLTSRIWFETARDSGYGAVFVGGRFEGGNGMLPQSGMNTEGLSFSRLATLTPEGKLLTESSSKVITDHVEYLKDVLHACKSIDDIRNYIRRNGHGFFNNEVCIFIERSGRYLIIEPDTMSSGNDARYVLANFCPSSTDLSKVRQQRYLNGVAFLKNKADTTLGFCTALSDTMHVCREKIGDGTLLTLIRDLNKGILHVYFYHDYRHVVTFNLEDELAKGDHAFEVPSLFPVNAEYQRLASFKTPQNDHRINLFMVFCVLFFSGSALYFLISFFRNRKAGSHARMKLLLFFANLVLLYYVFVLVRNENIFYFPAPYRDDHFSMLNVAAYIPFLLLILMIPFIKENFAVIKERSWHVVSIGLFILNNVVFAVLLGLFAYWGLFSALG